jgi:hypothetical protein
VNGPRSLGPNRSRWSRKLMCPMMRMEEVRKEFSEAEIVDLTYAITAISMRAVSGTYQPQKKASAIR